MDIAAVSNCNEALTGTNGDGYRGCQTKTKKGVTCQKWTSNSSDEDAENTPTTRPGKGLGDHNYCRNPDADAGGIWCFTTPDKVFYDYCSPLKSSGGLCLGRSLWRRTSAGFFVCSRFSVCANLLDWLFHISFSTLFLRFSVLKIHRLWFILIQTTHRSQDGFCVCR